MHTVSILAYDGMTGFESGLAAEIFGLAELTGPFSEGIERTWYSMRICSETPELRTIGGATMRTPYGLADLAEADTVVIPSVRDVTAQPSDALIEAIRAAERRGARLVSICSGAFALAAAGVLDGRPATTHWLYVDELRRRYPGIDVDPTPLYVDGGHVLTSAGCAAGLDLCLHIVRRDHGTKVANDVARRLVISPHRGGGQAQYVETPVPEPATDGRIAASMEWALGRLDRPITLDELATQASMSRRTYLRQFTSATGTTPIKWLIAQRIQASLPLLEASLLTIEQIAARVGFESPVTYRHHFVRGLKTTPSEYRSCFAAAG